MMENKSEIKYIDVTPTWEQILPALIMLIDNGNSKGRAGAIAELQRMAQIADIYVNQNKGK